MIHFKNHKAFMLIETMFAITIIAFIFTPLFILQGTVLQQVSRFFHRIERTFHAQQFMHETKRIVTLQAQEFTLEKKIDTPNTILKYTIVRPPDQSSLAPINGLYFEQVTLSWKDGTKKKEDIIINFIYKPEQKSS